MATDQMTEVIKLVNSEATRLGDFLSGLDDRAWSLDSACEGWVVGDVVAHLAIAAGTWSGSLTRAVAGDAGPPPGQSFLAPGVRGSETTAQAAISYHQQMGPKLLQEYTAGYDRLSQVLSGLRAEDWDKPCFHRRSPMPVSDYVALRVQELAVHGWDIRSSLDGSAKLGEEALPLLVDRVSRWLGNSFCPGQGLPTPTRYRFEVSKPVPVHQDTLVNIDNFQVEAAGTSQPDVIFRCDTGNYILFIFGRLTAGSATASGRLTIEGSPELAANFSAWFQGL